MQAVCEAELVDGKIVVLRKIADDISNAIGMKTDEWISSQYWYIKRFAGFHHARVSLCCAIFVMIGRVLFSHTPMPLNSYL
jgi:hypothetical protein